MDADNSIYIFISFLYGKFKPMIETIILISIWAYLYCGILTDAEGIFRWMPEVSNRIASFGKHGAVKSWNPNYFQDAILKWGYQCAPCHAGIVAVTWSLATQYWNIDVVIFSIAGAHFLTLIESKYLN